MDTVPLVRDIMVEANFSIRPEMPVHEAVDALIAKKTAGIPVIDTEGCLAGFLTEKDCLRVQAISHQYNITGMKVKDVMSAIKEPLEPDMDLLTAAMHFLSCNFATLPVLEGDKLVGSISRNNMLQAIRKLHQQKGLNIQLSKRSLEMFENPSAIGHLQHVVSRSSREQLAAVFGGRHLR